MVALLGVATPPPPDAGLLAHVSGLLAGYLAAVMMLLMARTPVSEHRVGPDVLARWHAVGGRLFLALVLVHAGAAVASWAAARGQDLLTATVSVVGLHLLTYVGIALSFVHELGGPNLAGQPVVQVLWTLLHAYALTLVLRFRVIAPLTNILRRRLRGVAVVPEGGRGGERGHAGQARRRAGGAARAVLPLAVPHLGHLAQRALVLAVRGAVGGSAPDHRQGTGYRQRARACRAGGDPRAPRRAVRGDDGRPTVASLCPVDRRRGRDHASARLVRVPGRRRWRGSEIIWLVGPSGDPELRMTGTNLLRLVPDVADRDVYRCAAPELSRAVRAALREVGLPARRLHEEAFSF
jgi:hypothetical protein